MLPLEIAGRGINRLNDIPRVWHIEDAVVGQRRPLLAASRQGACPDHAQLAHVLPGNLVERAVALAVERPAPHEPVVRRRSLEHRVGDRHEVVSGLRLRGRARRAAEACQHRDRCHPHSRCSKTRYRPGSTLSRHLETLGHGRPAATFSSARVPPSMTGIE